MVKDREYRAHVFKTGVSATGAKSPRLALPVGDGVHYGPSKMVVHDGTLIAVGSLLEADGLPVNGIARWDGSTWQSVGSGFAGGVITAAIYHDQIYVGGQMYLADGHDVDSIARWSVASILEHPVSQMAGAGDSVSFSATGTVADWTYQWRKDGIALGDGGRISGATTNLLTISAASTEDQGAYDVLMTNVCATQRSNPAALGIGIASSNCPTDTAPDGGDHMVNVFDLLDVITSWGLCP